MTARAVSGRRFGKAIENMPPARKTGGAAQAGRPLSGQGKDVVVARTRIQPSGSAVNGADTGSAQVPVATAGICGDHRCHGEAELRQELRGLQVDLTAERDFFRAKVDALAQLCDTYRSSQHQHDAGGGVQHEGSNQHTNKGVCREKAPGRGAITQVLMAGVASLLGGVGGLEPALEALLAAVTSNSRAGVCPPAPTVCPPPLGPSIRVPLEPHREPLAVGGPSRAGGFPTSDLGGINGDDQSSLTGMTLASHATRPLADTGARLAPSERDANGDSLDRDPVDVAVGGPSGPRHAVCPPDAGACNSGLSRPCVGPLVIPDVQQGSSAGREKSPHPSSAEGVAGTPMSDHLATSPSLSHATLYERRRSSEQGVSPLGPLELGQLAGVMKGGAGSAPAAGAPNMITLIRLPSTASISSWLASPSSSGSSRSGGGCSSVSTPSFPPPPSAEGPPTNEEEGSSRSSEPASDLPRISFSNHMSSSPCISVSTEVSASPRISFSSQVSASPRISISATSHALALAVSNASATPALALPPSGSEDGNRKPPPWRAPGFRVERPSSGAEGEQRSSAANENRTCDDEPNAHDRHGDGSGPSSEGGGSQGSASVAAAVLPCATQRGQVLTAQQLQSFTTEGGPSCTCQRGHRRSTWHDNVACGSSAVPRGSPPPSGQWLPVAPRSMNEEELAAIVRELAAVGAFGGDSPRSSVAGSLCPQPNDGDQAVCIMGGCEDQSRCTGAGMAPVSGVVAAPVRGGGAAAHSHGDGMEGGSVADAGADAGVSTSGGTLGKASMWNASGLVDAFESTLGDRVGDASMFPSGSDCGMADASVLFDVSMFRRDAAAAGEHAMLAHAERGAAILGQSAVPPADGSKECPMANPGAGKGYVSEADPAGGPEIMPPTAWSGSVLLGRIAAAGGDACEEGPTSKEDGSTSICDGPSSKEDPEVDPIAAMRARLQQLRLSSDAFWSTCGGPLSPCALAGEAPDVHLARGGVAGAGNASGCGAEGRLPGARGGMGGHRVPDDRHAADARREHMTDQLRESAHMPSWVMTEGPVGGQFSAQVGGVPPRQLLQSLDFSALMSARDQNTSMLMAWPDLLRGPAGDDPSMVMCRGSAEAGGDAGESLDLTAILEVASRNVAGGWAREDTVLHAGSSSASCEGGVYGGSAIGEETGSMPSGHRDVSEVGLAHVSSLSPPKTSSPVMKTAPGSHMPSGGGDWLNQMRISQADILSSLSLEKTVALQEWLVRRPAVAATDHGTALYKERK
eukprot:jgi/Mesvir1/27080/Mv20771-RA.1